MCLGIGTPLTATSSTITAKSSTIAYAGYAPMHCLCKAIYCRSQKVLLKLAISGNFHKPWFMNKYLATELATVCKHNTVLQYSLAVQMKQSYI